MYICTVLSAFFFRFTPHTLKKVRTVMFVCTLTPFLSYKNDAEMISFYRKELVMRSSPEEL